MSASRPTTTANPVATITNKSNSDVEIFDVFNNTGQINGLLTYTSLGKIAAGAQGQVQTLHFASQLQALYSGPVAALSGFVYYQFPVAVMAVSKLSDVTSFTLTNDDMTAMCQAFNFIRYSTANADSKLAKDFVSALSNKTDQQTAVNTFFAGTGSFKNVTMTQWTAMMGWQTQNLSAWQGTYYLYSNPDAQSDTPANLIATVSITSSATGENGVATIANSDGSPGTATTALAMAGDGTICEKTAGEGNLSVSLQPVWMNVVQTSNDNSASYLIGAALSGTSNGTAVTGTQQKSPSQSTAPTGSSGSSTSWLTVTQLVANITSSIVSTLTGFGTLMIMFLQYKESKGHALNNAENKAATDPKQTQSAIEEEQSKINSDYQAKIVSQLEPKAESVMAEAAKLPEMNSHLLTAQKEAALEGVVNRQEDQLNDVLEERPPTNDIEETAEKLETIQAEIPGGNPNALEQDLNAVKAGVESELRTSGTGMQQYEQDALNDVKSDIQETNEQQDAIDEAAEEQEAKMGQDDSEPLSPEDFDQPRETSEID